MKKSRLWASFLLVILGLMWIPPLVRAQTAANPSPNNYDRSCTFDVQYGDDRFSHTLYMSVPPSLYDYYHGEIHSIGDNGGYSEFVTPSAFQSIADDIRNATCGLPCSDEQFADAVLTLIHQDAYVKSGIRYPVETFADSSGDCEMLSLLAASIMKAGGLDVVLLYYNDLLPSHMNVGVYLPYTPAYNSWWMPTASYEYDNKSYWMAECTPSMNWKVGDCPPELVNAKPTIVPVENCEKSSPAQVSSSLDIPLTSSSIDINLSPENSSLGNSVQTFTISGSISPAYTGKSVVIYLSQDGYPCSTLSTVTDDFGNYSLAWNFTSTGTCCVRASLNGFSNYAGSDSETLTVFVGPPQSQAENSALEHYSGGPDYASSSTSVLSAFENSVNQSSGEFLESNLTGTDVVLSGEFDILRSGQTVTVSKNYDTIVYDGTRIWTRRDGSLIAQPDEEQVVTTMKSNQTVTDQFGFILQQNGGDNYTASVKVLNDNDVSQITTGIDGNNTGLMNATPDTRDNTWYKVVARVTGDAVTTELYDENGTLLKNAAAQNDAANRSESGILMTNATVVAFKNLNAETLNHPTSPVSENQRPASGPQQFAPYNGLVILLAVVVTAIAYVKERRSLTSQQPAYRGKPVN